MTETEAKWVERLREWQGSGKKAEEFAAGKPYKASTLNWWRTELQRRGVVQGQTRQRRKSIPMARVVRNVGTRMPTTSAAMADGMVVEISSARISIAQGSDMELFAKVIRILGRSQ
jgi:hypothetical protein